MDTSILDRHERVVLQFSGGKDSITVLHLLREHLHRMTVMWINTGDAYPATIAQMAEVALSVPHFVEVNANQPEHIKQNGWPVDVLPVRVTAYGRSIEGTEGQLMQPYPMCCSANMWQPGVDAVKALGATLVIRGTRSADLFKSPLPPNRIVNGVEYWLPIEDWADRDVLDYIANNELPLPDNYRVMSTSLTCMHCTAYAQERRGVMNYLRLWHRDVAAEVDARMGIIQAEVKVETDRLTWGVW